MAFFALQKAEDMAGAAQNAYQKLLAAELGRLLSSQVRRVAW